MFRIISSRLNLVTMRSFHVGRQHGKYVRAVTAQLALVFEAGGVLLPRVHVHRANVLLHVSHFPSPAKRFDKKLQTEKQTHGRNSTSFAYR